MKKLITVLVVILILLGLAIAGALGYLWYRENHIFVEDAVYSIHEEQLDLRGQEISLEHYESVRSQLPNCHILWDVPFQDQRVSSTTNTLTVTALSDEDIQRMDYFTGLISVDATGCGDYGQIEKLMAHRPGLRVSYLIGLGGISCEPDTDRLVLENGDYEFSTLLENLTWLRDLTAVHLRMPQLTQEQIGQLQEAYPDIAFTCSVELLGEEYDVETTQLDLSGLTSGDLARALEQLPLLPNVTTVNLNDASAASPPVRSSS